MKKTRLLFLICTITNLNLHIFKCTNFRFEYFRKIFYSLTNFVEAPYLLPYNNPLPCNIWYLKADIALITAFTLYLAPPTNMGIKWILCQFYYITTLSTCSLSLSFHHFFLNFHIKNSTINFTMLLLAVVTKTLVHLLHLIMIIIYYVIYISLHST